jgi:hypothetical protein
MTSHQAPQIRLLFSFRWEKTSMRRLCLGIAGTVVAVSLAGCGESADEGQHTYKGSNSPEIQKQMETQAANMKNKTAFSKGEEKPADKKDKEKDKAPEKKPAADPAAK